MAKEKTKAEKKQKLQWHPAFAAALEMELWENKDDLEFEMEHNLNRKPLLIDCLVIKKKKNAIIRNEIGKFFKKYNILEYKSARASLSIDDVSKTQGYAHLYKAYGEGINTIGFDEVSVTLIRESKPIGLFKYFEENSYMVSNPYKGIYYIESGLKFPTQIIVGKELTHENHEWFNLLSDNVTKQEMARAIEYSRKVSNKKERELIDAIFEVGALANKNIVEELKMGDEDMCQALMEIMKPEIEEVVNTAVLQERRETTERVEKETTERVKKETAERVEKETTERVKKETTERVEKETTERAIKVAVEMLRSLNLGNVEIKKALQKNYKLSEEEALSYLK